VEGIGTNVPGHNTPATTVLIGLGNA
jgi:hypothetical protein